MGDISDGATGDQFLLSGTPAASDEESFDFPSDELVHLRRAFDLLGKHRFGALWDNDMARTVRMGPKRVDPEKLKRGRWALKALVQCVENGWLPLVYIVGNQRVRYFENATGAALHALYPEPQDGEPGQIELVGGGIYPCMVHVGTFSDVLRTRFGLPSRGKRGPRRGFNEVDQALDRYFADNPHGKRNTDVSHELAVEAPDLVWPGKTVRNQRINEARKRAAGNVKFARQTPDETPTGR